MALRIIESEWRDLTNVDTATYELAKKIEALSEGMTPKQFCDAVSIAISFIGRYSTLSVQSVPELSKRG